MPRLNIKKLAFSKKFILSAVLFLSLLQIYLIQSADIAQANLWDTQKESGMTYVGSVYGSPDVPIDIRVIVARIIYYLLGLLGIIFLVLIILAGYKWMTASGEESKVEEAKKQLQAAVIGLLIILASWSITIFVTSCILKAAIDPNNPWYCI